MTGTQTTPPGWRLAAPVDLHPGDETTETVTPVGPTYPVARVDTVRRLLVLDDGIKVPLGAPTALVLARRPTPHP